MITSVNGLNRFDSLSTISSRRSFVMSSADGDMSIPIHCRLSCSAATQAVAHPQNGSRMMSPSFDDALMIRSSRATGFCVGQPVSSLDLAFCWKDIMSDQTSVNATPLDWSRYWRLLLGLF